MFTGIIQTIAEVYAVEKKEGSIHYGILFPSSLLEGLELGASVSIDGVCQTVVTIDNQIVWFDAIEETLIRTTLRHLKKKMHVNIERAAKWGEEIGGHLLSGHIFGKASLLDIQENRYFFSAPPLGMKYLFEKGFIALDGVSLTLASCDRSKKIFSIHLIPETMKRTLLGQKKRGDEVNVEIDALTQAAVETVENLLGKSYHS